MSNLPSIERYLPFMFRSASFIEADLQAYAELLNRWQSVQNLVSRETLSALWERHFADSLQLLPLLHSTDKIFRDLGSGGGFPALPLAIACKGDGRHFHLVEPTARKVSFLRTVARELDLSVTVHGSRIEQLDSRETPDVITSRALASLPQLCSWMAPFFGSKTRALLHKGKEHGEEVREARAQWDFDVVEHRSDTDPAGVVLEISNLRERPTA
ncbi:16S rRNA (guanine(527)-N(7))-methyltransferase RsmG [Devosia albogilva]|uniref:Ribosomal RNA small subunit methyltransferase G n=1 Tax=Devosia albogilva TaxID=429726 RepID=A0ABW5QKE4_9HYPH